MDGRDENIRTQANIQRVPAYFALNRARASSSNRNQPAAMHDDRRLEDLEIKLAHVERGLQELSDVVVRQQAGDRSVAACEHASRRATGHGRE